MSRNAMSHGDARDFVEAVGVILVDHRGWILLQRRDGRGLYPHHWATVGGTVEAGETLEAAVRRELYEETGYTLSTPLRFGSRSTLTMPHGQVRDVTIFFARYDGVQPIACHEGLEITFVNPATLAALSVYPGQKELILEALRRCRESGRSDSFTGPVT
jgi:8-oxo-dGTP pyrophosphatase MutT (NUDIX family)